jgi:DNA processing protein
MKYTNISELDFKIDELKSMKKYPPYLSYIGNLELLKKRKVSIVGSRNPNQYAQYFTNLIATKLSQKDITVVSGCAMGVDAIAHKAAGTNNTIGVAGTGLDIRYPRVNSGLINEIENNGLMLSQFKPNTPSQRYNFPIRNETVVALGEILIVTQADLKSGTLRSVEYALKMDKKVFVLPHRIGESQGTSQLLEQNNATAIYNIDDFIDNFIGYRGDIKHTDPFLQYCKTNPTYDEAMLKYPSELFQYELEGKIIIKDGHINIQ